MQYLRRKQVSFTKQPHSKQRFASAFAVSSEKPSSTSLKLFFASITGSSGISWRSIFSYIEYSSGLTSCNVLAFLLSKGISSGVISPVSKNLFIAVAAILPSAMASIAVAAPLLKSPPAKILPKPVNIVDSSTIAVCQRETGNILSAT